MAKDVNKLIKFKLILRIQPLDHPIQHLNIIHDYLIKAFLILRYCFKRITKRFDNKTIIIHFKKIKTYSQPYPNIFMSQSNRFV